MRIAALLSGPGGKSPHQTIDERAEAGESDERRSEHETAVQVRPEDLQCREAPERSTLSGASPRQKPQEESHHQISEDVRPHEKARCGQDEYEGEGGESDSRGGAQRPRGGIEESGDRQGDQRS